MSPQPWLETQSAHDLGALRMRRLRDGYPHVAQRAGELDLTAADERERSRQRHAGASRRANQAVLAMAIRGLRTRR